MQTIVLDLPPSINSYYKTRQGGGFYKTKKAKAWENIAWWTLKKLKKYGNKKVVMYVYYYFRDNNSDISNRTKILQDAFERSGVIDNDKQIYENHEYKRIDKKEPRVDILIQENKNV